eukprot:366136-Chlamydomonas_euryale.AAC.6
MHWHPARVHALAPCPRPCTGTQPVSMHWHPARVHRLASRPCPCTGTPHVSMHWHLAALVNPPYHDVGAHVLAQCEHRAEVLDIERDVGRRLARMAVADKEAARVNR